jgi:flagella basal body P-ring formation protein FlgA
MMPDNRVKFSSILLRLSLVMLSLVIWAWGQGAARAENGVATLTLPERALVAGDHIVLKEIGEITWGTGGAGKPVGPNDTDGPREALAGVVVGRSPLPGKTRWIDRDYIALRLKQNGFDPDAVTLRGPDRIEIAREAVTISKNEIKAMVLEFLGGRLESVDEAAVIGQIRGAKDIVLPKGRVTRGIEIPAREDLAGNVRVTISFNVDGQSARRLHVYARINRMIEAVTAIRPLGRGRIITEADVCLKKMDWADVSSNALVRIEDAVGKITRKRIEVNAALRPDMVERPFLVGRGDIVKIVARSERINIVTLGEVRKKGRRDDRVRVLNLDSNNEVYARVIDAGTVGVNY